MNFRFTEFFFSLIKFETVLTQTRKLMNPDISKQDLYEAVKTLVECDEPHIHLHQHKLFTLFSIAFQYMLFRSTKKPGCYIIRVEDSILADKLAKNQKTLLPANSFRPSSFLENLSMKDQPFILITSI